MLDEQAIHLCADVGPNRMRIGVEEDEHVCVDVAHGEIQDMSVVVAGHLEVRLASRIGKDVHVAEECAEAGGGCRRSVLVDDVDVPVAESGECAPGAGEQELHPERVAVMSREQSRPHGMIVGAPYTPRDVGSGAPLTAIVSSHNEAHLLERCLPTLAFCADLIVIDIASNDDTAAVARAHGARVFRHAWVPIAERARLELVGEASHEWLLFMDPDEAMPAALAAQLTELVPQLPEDVGVVDCPWQFHFRDRPLEGTVWGGISRKRTLARRGGAELRPTVHSGTKPLDGYRIENVEYTGDNAIAHFWAPGWRPLIEKHRRYLGLEGRDRLAQGLVTGPRDIVGTPLPAFYESYVQRRGYRDGLVGLGLSLLWATYTTGAKLALLREMRRTGTTVMARGD